MLLYYITDRQQLPGNEGQKRARLLEKIAAAARAGVDYIQLRERDLSVRDLESLAREAVRIVREMNDARAASAEFPANRRTRLLINSRTDVALAVGADGVHLRSDDITPSEARAIWHKVPGRDAAPAMRASGPLIAVSCHTCEEVRLAESHGADFAVFAPVFEKRAFPPRTGSGLGVLSEVCRPRKPAVNVEGVAAGRLPVLALGGVTWENARACLDAGAAGIAAIRLFQDSDMTEVIAKLRQRT
jgi:thiamine-phosphate pyrophosphorylase